MPIQKVKDVMTGNPVFIDMDSTLEEAAEKMRFIDCGALPIVYNHKLKGIITDRDIVIRAISKGVKPNKARVADYMTPHLYSCNEEDTLKDAIEKMVDHKVTRLVVMNHNGDVTGIISFGGLLRKDATPSDVVHIVERASVHFAA